jgi:hypothetical protein
MIMEQSAEFELVGEAELLGEHLPQYHFVNYKTCVIWPNVLFPSERFVFCAMLLRQMPARAIPVYFGRCAMKMDTTRTYKDRKNRVSHWFNLQQISDDVIAFQGP